VGCLVLFVTGWWFVFTGVNLLGDSNRVLTAAEMTLASAILAIPLIGAS